MTTIVIILAFLIATTFVGWPIMSRYCGQNAAWSGSIVFFFTAITPILFSSTTLLRTPAPDSKSLMILSAAGILNGLGVYFYSQTLEKVGDQSGTFIVTVSIAMVMVAPILSYLFNGETLTTKQFAGLACAVSAVYLLR